MENSAFCPSYIYRDACEGPRTNRPDSGIVAKTSQNMPKSIETESESLIMDSLTCDSSALCPIPHVQVNPESDGVPVKINPWTVWEDVGQ